MEQGHSTHTQNGPNAGSPDDGRRVLDPVEDARRELVQWCQEHGLPVPPERQSSER